MRNIKTFENFHSEDHSIQEGHDEMHNYMFFQNLYTLKNAIEEIMEMDPHKVDEILSDGHGWALDHIATSVDDVEEVYHFLSNSVEMGDKFGGGDHDHDDDDHEGPISVNIEGDDDKVEVETEEE
jgi:hypothetical protein